MESFSEAIKVFAEKHLIPTILSLVIAAIAFAFTPADYWLLEKFTKIGYLLFVAGVIFILIQFLIWIQKTIIERLYLRSLRKSNAEYEKKQNEEYREQLWDLVDSFCQEDIKYLKQFLKNNNKPIIIRGRVFYPYGRLFESPYVKKQEGYDGQGYFVKYILEENFYHNLKVSARQYGKIGHFEEV